MLQMQTTTRLGMLLVGLLVGMGLVASSAAALPSDYQIQRGLLRVDIELGHHSFEYNLSVRRGNFTFDDETGELSNLRLNLGYSVIRFDESIDAGALGTVRPVGDSSLYLRLAGIELPPSLPWFVGDTADLRIVARSLSIQPIRPLPPVAAVPEPTAALLFGAGIVAISTATRRNRA